MTEATQGGRVYRHGAGKYGETIKVRGKDSIALHWFNALVWALMIGTGTGIISGADVRFAPAFWPEFLQDLFGGNANLTLVHSIIGMVWAGVFVLYSLFYAKRVAKFLSQVLVLTPWGAVINFYSMMDSLLGLVGLHLPGAPKAGRFNGAQRLLGTLIILGSVVIFLSGMYLYFGPQLFNFHENELAQSAFQWALVAHIAMVALVLFGVVAHIYYAVVEEREALSSMTTGEMPVHFIKHHSPKWYQELKDRGEVD